MKPDSRVRFNVPPEIAVALKLLQEAVDNLAKISKHKQKKFTLDGRLVGDIGEVLAAELFDLVLNENQETGFDAKAGSGEYKGKPVEVKCRRNSKDIEFHDIPELLVVLALEQADKVVELVYLGPGAVLQKIRPDAAPDAKGRFKIRVSLAMLRNKFDQSGFPDSSPLPLRPGIQPLSSQS